MDERDDIEFTPDNGEAFELEEVEALEENKLTELKNKLKQCQKERQEHLDGWQRAQAETLNIKKRLEEEKQTDRARTQATFVEKLLPLCDSFDAAMQDREAWKAAPDSWRRGVEAIHGQLANILASYNVTKIGTEGEVFNPETHEAVSSVPVDSEDMHECIASVLQSGYMMGNRLVRPAKVTVGEFEK